MTNWNQVVARGFGSADDEWGRAGSAERVDLLNKNLKRLQKNGKWSLAAVTSAMNAAATQDIRAIDTVPLLAKLLKGSTGPEPAGRADARADGRLEERRRQPPRPATTTARSTIRARPSWTAPGRTSPTRS